jgi:hypothetical protein
MFLHERCYGLNMKYLPEKAHLLKLRSPASGTILRGSGNFRMLDLPGGSRSLEAGSRGYLVPCPLSLSLLPVYHEVSSYSPPHAPAAFKFCPNT